MLKWKKGPHGRPETADGRFYVDGHWNEKPGYYELVDTQTRLRQRGTKLKDLKTVAETVVSNASVTKVLGRKEIGDGHPKG